MGIGYDKSVTQWSKGEYLNANNHEDDIAIIRSSLGFIYKTDGNVKERATPINAPSGMVNHANLITDASDVDFYRIRVNTDTIATVSARPADIAPNLDVYLELQDAYGNTLTKNDPQGDLGAAIAYPVRASEFYYLMVKGTGRGNSLIDGYSNYGSIGYYSLGGNIPGMLQRPIITSSTNDVSQTVGTTFSYQITALNQPTTFYASISTNGAPAVVQGLGEALPNGAFIFTPTNSGIHTIRLIALNSEGADIVQLRLIVTSPPDLARALDSTGLAWATSPDAAWFTESATAYDGVEAAQSGPIRDKRESWLQTTATGPSTLAFWWKVSSVVEYDYLGLYVNNILQNGRISGETGWRRELVAIPNGLQTIRWRFGGDQNPDGREGNGWVDRVSFSPVVLTGIATRVKNTETMVQGMVNPNGSSSAVRFEYGPTTSLGGTIAAAETPLNGNASVNVSATLKDLAPGSSYHYRLRVENTGGTSYGAIMSFTTPVLPLIAWGDDSHGQTDVLNDWSGGAPIAIAAGGFHSVALRDDGRVLAWGDNSYGQTNVPINLNGISVSAIACGFNHTLALKDAGTVIAWGDNSGGQRDVPSGLSGIVSVAGGVSYTVALRSDGTVVQWGRIYPRQSVSVPEGLSGVGGIAAGSFHVAALKSNGTVIAWGLNSSGQTNVPLTLDGVSAIAAGANHTVALKRDGSVIAWGSNTAGQTNVPATLTEVVAIAAGGDLTVALTSAGRVVAWGNMSSGQADVPRAATSSISGIAAGYSHTLALVDSGRIRSRPVISEQPISGAVAGGNAARLHISASGNPEPSFQWLRDGKTIAGATGATLLLTNVTLDLAGRYSAQVFNAVGSVVSTTASLTVVSALFKSIPLQNVETIRTMGFALDLGVETGSAFRVQGSPDMRIWSDVARFTATGQPLHFFDATGRSVDQRFYRIVSP